MKKMYQVSALVITMLCHFDGIPAYAGKADDIEVMKQQIQELMAQNQQLNTRIVELEQNRRGEISSPKSDTNKAEIPGTSNMMSTNVSFGGVIEVEAGWSEKFGGGSSSSIDLAKAEFAFEAQVSKWATGVLAIEWDDDDDKLTIDEAFISIGNIDEGPGFFQAGRFVVPFGIYHGNTITDPLTKEAFETKEDAVLGGFEFSGFCANAYVFNGETNEGGGDDTIEHFGGSFGYHLNNEEMAFDASVDFISSVFDADGLTDGFSDSLESDYVRGLAAHAIFTMGGFGIIGEYITALDEVDGVEPTAWQIEGCYETQVADRSLIITLGYSGTEELGGILAESMIAAALGIDLSEGFGLSFEYRHDEDYEKSDGGTGEPADAFTLQLAYEL